MNEIESREFYYSPLCKLFLKNLPYLKEIEDSLIKIKNNKVEERKEERNNECEKLSKYLKENIIGRKYKKVSFATDSIDPFFVIKEIIFTGKDDWTASAIENDKIDKNYSQFGDKIIKIVKSAYLKENISSNSKKSKDAITGGIISEKILE
ncbi:MAG: hypothetical protein J6Z11_04245, partial [Candidatus Riflebacteria bacterium]|nr:hypothetical protein [Candidatus Riflebacteria bacterium]